MTEPMTAAEYRQWCNVGLGVNTERVLAALEERERLLGEVAVMKDERDRAKHEAAEVRRLCEADAALGALVRRIREHPMATEITRLNITVGGPRTDWGEEFLREALSHLDSLLPKEPEVVVKLGGRTWTFGTSPVGNTNVWWRPGDGTATVVASGELELALNALNALGGGKDG